MLRFHFAISRILYPYSFRIIKSVSIYLILTTLLFSCTSAETYWQRADIAMNQGHYAEAIRLLDKAIAEDKFFSPAFLDKGMCYEMLEKDDSAIIVYNQLLSFDPENIMALYGVGLSYYRLEKYDEAISILEAAMKSKGFNPHDSSRQVLTTFEYSPAAKKLLGIPEKPDIPLGKIFYTTGLAYYDNGKVREAYKYFMLSISEGYRLADSYFMAGACLIGLGKIEKACESFATSIFHGDQDAIKMHLKYCK